MTAHLVGVLQDEVLALVQLAADIDDTAEDSPGVLHAQVDLAGELIGFELLGAQDHMTSRVLYVVPRHVPEDTVIERLQSVQALTNYCSVTICAYCWGLSQPVFADMISKPWNRLVTFVQYRHHIVSGFYTQKSYLQIIYEC